MSPSRRRLALACCLIALGAYEGFAYFVREMGAPSNLPAITGLTPEFAPDQSLTQMFVMHADGFSGIDVFPKVAVAPPGGSVRMRLLDGRTGVWTPAASATFDSATIDLTRPLHLAVPRMEDSVGRLYILEIEVQGPSGHHIRFEVGPPGYQEGVLRISGRNLWGNLKFRTYAQRVTVISNVLHLRQSLPAWLRSDAVWIAIFLVFNAALAVVIYDLVFAPEAGRVAAQRSNGSASEVVDQPRV